MNRKWLTAGIALIAAIVIGGVTATALAVDPVNAETVARSTSHVITDIGDIHIKSLTDGNTGKPFNGVLPDGTEVSDGVNAGSQTISYILTVNGTIDDVGQLHEGDTVTWTVQPTANSHFRLGGMSGPAQLTDSDGDPVFNVRYSNSTTSLTRTSTPAMGRYDFTLQYGKKNDYRFYGSWESTFSTTSGITIGDETITFDNDPIRLVSDRDGFNASMGQGGLSSDGSIFEMKFNHGGEVNRILNDEASAMDDDPVIGYARITPTQGEIKAVTFSSLWSRWGLAYDATHAGRGANDFLVLKLAGKHVDRHVTSWDEAKTLKPGEYTMTRNADGSYDVAVNLGSEQGDNALLSDEPSSWDEQTDNIVRKAIAEKTAGQWMSMRWSLTYADQYIANKATAIGVIRKSTATEGGAFNTQLYNSVGSQAGAGQSSIIYNGNGATEGSMGMQVGDPDTNATIQANKYKRQGYKFTGWNTKPDGTGDTYRPGDSITLTGDITLYAQWKADKAALHYDANANTATGDTPDSEGVTDGTITVSKNGYANVGYTFTGWNTKPDGTGSTIQPGDAVKLPAGGMTVYAQWETVEYPLVYDLNGGTGKAPNG